MYNLISTQTIMLVLRVHIQCTTWKCTRTPGIRLFWDLYPIWVRRGLAVLGVGQFVDLAEREWGYNRPP